MVLRVLTVILCTAGTDATTSAKLASDACFLASYKQFKFLTKEIQSWPKKFNHEMFSIMHPGPKDALHSRKLPVFDF